MGEEQTTVVDWGKIEEDILCPLCEYNLRGLGEARCPECGYRFEWVELIDPERRRHLYLFEHHPRRKVWAFWRTLVGGVRPRRFWRSLTAGHAVYGGRLALYAVLVSVVVLLLPVAIVGVDGFEITRLHLRDRAELIANFESTSARGIATRQIFTSRDSLLYTLNLRYPLPPSSEFFRQLFARFRTGGGPEAARTCAVLVVAWPWLTYLVLMIFAASMRRASVRRIHVVRCVVYCGDAAGWAVIATAVVGILCSLAMAGLSVELLFDWTEPVPLAASLVFLILFTYRLAMAYRYYLKFDHPVATVIASQVIAVLIALIVSVSIEGRI